MENYKIYCNLKSELKRKKQLLADLQQKPTNKEDLISLEIDIEEDMNALNIVFNHLILNHNTLPSVEMR
ncbi:MAG: hypothetical protein EOP42_01425 [Sphingobacteriaceae bacterium]|nr:MAG: hypothetical protein EOP42_01425 [Sphingobacteriaceae bacterium]